MPVTMLLEFRDRVYSHRCGEENAVAEEARYREASLVFYKPDECGLDFSGVSHSSHSRPFCSCAAIFLLVFLLSSSLSSSSSSSSSSFSKLVIPLFDHHLPSLTSSLLLLLASFYSILFALPFIRRGTPSKLCRSNILGTVFLRRSGEKLIFALTSQLRR